MDEPTQLQPVQATRVEGYARCCRVPGCTADLAKEADYSRKHRVCDAHRNASEVTLPEGLHKWCQGCTAYLVIEMFVRKKGRCDKCLDKIAQSRKRIKDDTETEDSDDDSNSVRKHNGRRAASTKSNKCSRPNVQAKLSRKGNARAAVKQQKPITERKARKAGGTSNPPPSSPMSTHTELYATEPHVLQLYHQGTSGLSSSVGLTPSQIPPGRSLGNAHARTQTQWSVQVALPAVPSQLQLASTASLDLRDRHPTYDAGYDDAPADIPCATLGACGIDNGGHQPVPFPLGSNLPLGLPPLPAPPCTSPLTHVSCLPWLPDGLDMGAIFSNDVCNFPEQLPMFDTGFLSIDDDQLLDGELQWLLDGM